MQAEKTTIAAAAKALGVSQKTIYRYLNNGTLSRIREGKNTYILVDEVRTLRTDMTGAEKEPVRTKHTDTDTDKITLSLKQYTDLIDELGQYKNQVSGQARYLLEYKEDLQTKDKDLAEARATLARANSELRRLVEIRADAERKAETLAEREAEVDRLRAENARLRLPWWRRWMKK
jgi:DNA repair ATPase RecN